MYYNKYSYWQIRHILAEWNYKLERIPIYKDRIGHYNILDKKQNPVVQHATLNQIRLLLTKLGVPVNYDPHSPQKSPKHS